MSKSTLRSRSRFTLVITFIAIFVCAIGIAVLVRPSSALTNNGSITTFGSPLTENFDTLASSGTPAWTDNSTIPGWYAQFGSTANPAAYTPSTGSSGTGALYSFGAALTNPITDRALGSVGSGTTTDIYWAAKFTNSTGGTITSLNVSYTGEQWRAGGCVPTPCTPAAQTVDFQYQVANAAVITDANTPTNNWIDHDALDFTSPAPGTSTAAAIDGNAAANRTALSSTITVTVNPGQEVWLRWKDINHANNDHGLAIDDLSVTANGGGTPTPTPTPTSTPTPTPTPTPATNVIINEIDSDTPGADSAEFIELYDGGAGNTSLNGLIVVLYDGSSNTSYNAFDLSGRTTDANGYFVLGDAAVPGVDFVVGNGFLQNGEDAVALYAASVAAFPNGTAVTTTNLQDAIVYDTSDPDDPELAVLLNAGQPQVNEDGNGNGDTQSIGRCPNGSGGQRNTSTYLQGTPTPDGPNNCTAPPPANDVVISQIYGGGGNTGATLKNDYIELINHSSSPVNLSGWSVQAFVSTTSTWQMTPLPNFTLQPGQYFLIQESQGAGGTDNLPTPDAVGTIPVSSTSTKVAVVNNTTVLTAACPNAAAAGIVDLVGYGGTDCFEGAATAPTLDNTTANFRRNGGCFDTNENANDFVTGSPSPRNSSSPTHDCTGLSAYGSASPSSVLQGDSSTLTVYVAGAQNPSSTGITVTADLSQIGGSSSQSFSGSGSVFTFAATIPANNSPGMKSLPVTVTDAQSRTVNTNILLSILPLIADHVTISQVYGGGGNTGATYTNDYVELYNPTANTITITGWSLQYASAAGTLWTNKQPLGGVIGPGEYYLVSLASGGATGAPLPVSPNISGDINISATSGKIALVSNSANLSGGCPLGSDPDIVDFVGYGTGATCHEGNANTPAPSNSTAIFRKNNGSLDADQNGTDFQTGVPSPRRTAPIVELGPWVSGTDPGTDGNTIPYDATITVNFSEPVTVDPGWWSINCTVTGPHTSATEAHFGDLKTYAVTPNVSFQFGEQCTVTITKTAVHDVDLDDSGQDTDTLFEDYTWSFTVVGAGQAAPYPPSVHLTMGNPSNATASLANFNNFLMEKPTYSLSYNRDKGTPNWVSWHLDSSWYGTLARVDTFRPDPAVDPTWYRVQAFDYSGSGFDRGHMTPNADRDNQNRIPINQETYLMSNMVPQSPDNNQGPWAAFEGYLRTQTDAGNEIYIVSGPNGVGGTGSNGSFNTIANGHVTVPSSTWKVALVLPQATGDDTARVTCSTRTIAVVMPNVQGIRTDPWENYLTTVDAVEALTGYDLFSTLPPAVQACIEGGTNGTNPPGTANQSATTTEDNSVTVTLQALQANNNTLTFSIVNGPASGSLGSIGLATCSSGTCSATVTYTPGADFNGADSFTFRASDGSLNSNTSTVSVSVSEVNDSPSAATDSKSTAEDLQLNFSASDLTTNDSAGPPNEATQSLTVTAVSGDLNTHGTVALLSGMINYSPAANYNGPASFSYTVCDDGTTNGAPDAKCTTGTVNVTVTPVNDAPTADSQNVSTGGNTPVAITLTGSDLETAPANLTFNVTSGPSHGTLSGTAPNLTYTPALNYCGSDSFKFTVTDTGDGSAAPLTSSEATVSITVNDTIGPTITLTGEVLALSPANHKYETVSISNMVASASDYCDPSVDIADVVITQVTSDELDDAPGTDDGNTVNDIVIAPDCRSVQLRAERNGSLNGRVYTVTLKVADSAGNVTTVTRQVTVPLSPGSGAAVDSGPAYTVNSLCP